MNRVFTPRLAGTCTSPSFSLPFFARSRPALCAVAAPPPPTPMAVCLDVKSFAMARDDKGQEFAVCAGAPSPSSAAPGASPASPFSPQIFVVNIRLGSYFWTVYRRYKQFKTLCDQVGTALPCPRPPLHASFWVCSGCACVCLCAVGPRAPLFPSPCVCYLCCVYVWSASLPFLTHPPPHTWGDVSVYVCRCLALCPRSPLLPSSRSPSPLPPPPARRPLLPLLLTYPLTSHIFWCFADVWLMSA